MTNAEVKRRVRLEDDIIDQIKRIKMGLFGHICRMDSKRMLKKTMFGMMDGETEWGGPEEYGSMISWIGQK